MGFCMVYIVYMESLNAFFLQGRGVYCMGRGGGP